MKRRNGVSKAKKELLVEKAREILKIETLYSKKELYVLLHPLSIRNKYSVQDVVKSLISLNAIEKHGEIKAFVTVL